MSLLLLIIPFLLSLLPPSLPSPLDFSTHIDCGGSETTVDSYGTTWLSDRFFTGGSSSVVSEPLQFHLPPEKTLRYFPPTTSGKKNCYLIPLPPSPSPSPSRFHLRTFTVYDNYDGKNHPPSFDVSVQGTVVFSFRSPWSPSFARSGFYSGLFAFASSSHADVCFYSIATDPPVVASLELTAIDPASYDAGLLGNNYTLVNYGRISAAGRQWGPGFTNDTDSFGRSWQPEEGFRSEAAKGVKSVTAAKNRSIGNVEVAPNYFPAKLYETAVTAVGKGAVLEYELDVDAKMDYLLWFHFAEIDGKVSKVGERLFDVLVNGVNVNRIDVFKEAGGRAFSAYDWQYVAKSLSTTSLKVRFVGAVGDPIVCAIENYAIVPNDLATVPEQVLAMRALKDSFHVPDRMGWNGDPCAPTTWDAWEGVTCRTNRNGSALIVSGIDLSSQGLKGSISDQIDLLTDLMTLNLSLNSLEGSVPVGLGQLPLVRLDLSNNKLTGPIPDTLTSSTLRLVLLNDNQLEGQVPEELYSIGVHGGVIDLSGNKGLCGVSPLPECPVFWHNGRLSNHGKIAIGVSFLVVFCLVVLGIYIYIKKRRNDYDFALPHELMSLAAKRNRYQRQKSLMDMEMESQHAKGYIPTLEPQ